MCVIELVNDFFGYFIIVCWENKEIQKFIEAEKSRDQKYGYSNFEFVYNECKKHTH
ncbi:MAG TPA: hypothetical protein VGK25_07705 [Ignavibacteria bacterium]